MARSRKTISRHFDTIARPKVGRAERLTAGITAARCARHDGHDEAPTKKREMGGET
jgi:hypothetical protein